MAPTPLGQLLEAANKGILFSNIPSRDRNATVQDGGPSIRSSNSQINLRSSTLENARKTIHALVLRAAHRSLVDGAIADFLQEWMKAPKTVQTSSDIPAIDRPPGFVDQQQGLEISSPSPDMPPGFDMVSALCLPRFLICWDHRVRIRAVVCFLYM